MNSKSYSPKFTVQSLFVMLPSQKNTLHQIFSHCAEPRCHGNPSAGSGRSVYEQTCNSFLLAKVTAFKIIKTKYQQLQKNMSDLIMREQRYLNRNIVTDDCKWTEVLWSEGESLACLKCKWMEWNSNMFLVRFDTEKQLQGLLTSFFCATSHSAWINAKHTLNSC